MNSTLRAVGISASPDGPSSRSRALLDRALESIAARGVLTERVDLASLPAEALLARGRAPQVDAALSATILADLVLVATPVYRATYAGLLKVFFDLLPTDALARKVAIVIAAGGSAAHQLALDHGLRPLLASVGAVVVATGVYATPEHFTGGAPDRGVLERLDRAVHEALTLAGHSIPHHVPESHPTAVHAGR